MDHKQKKWEEMNHKYKKLGERGPKTKESVRGTNNINKCTNDEMFFFVPIVPAWAKIVFLNHNNIFITF